MRSAMVMSAGVSESESRRWSGEKGRTLLYFESSVELVGSGDGHDLLSKAGIYAVDSGVSLPSFPLAPRPTHATSSSDAHSANPQAVPQTASIQPAS
jgi:hypothetical protein